MWKFVLDREIRQFFSRSFHLFDRSAIYYHVVFHWFPWAGISLLFAQGQFAALLTFWGRGHWWWRLPMVLVGVQVAVLVYVVTYGNFANQISAASRFQALSPLEAYLVTYLLFGLLPPFLVGVVGYHFGFRLRHTSDLVQTNPVWNYRLIDLCLCILALCLLLGTGNHLYEEMRPMRLSRDEWQQGVMLLLAATLANSVGVFFRYRWALLFVALGSISVTAIRYLPNQVSSWLYSSNYRFKDDFRIAAVLFSQMSLALLIQRALLKEIGFRLEWRSWRRKTASAPSVVDQE